MDPQAPASNDRLHSWKEIAAYLKRDVTTVRRWEKREGLPVHRHLHDRRDSVYAFPAELDGWLEGRRNTGPAALEPQGRTWPGTRISLAIAAAVVMSGALVAVTYLRASPPDTGAVRVPFSVPHPLVLADAATGGDFSISPDGRRLAFVAAAADGTRRLWIRPLDSLAAVALAETEGATSPFWSPDGEFVGFFAQRALKKIAAAGGPVQILADAVLPRGGAWNAEGVILFAVNAGEQLYRVSSAGGQVTRLNLNQVSSESHWPDFLPDGRHFIYHGRRPQPGIYLGALDSPETHLLATGYVSAEYASGHMLLLTGGTQSQTSGTLMAQAFDTTSLRLVGEAAPLADAVAIRPQFAHGVFSTSETGTVMYGTNRHQVTQLVWRDREGRTVGTATGPGRYERAALSPDERTVAVEVIDPHLETQDIWLVEASRGVMSRFTSEPSAERMPLWSPNGTRLLFSSPREGRPPRLFTKMTNGATETPFFESDLILQPTDWSRDGRFIVYGRRDSKTQWDLWVVNATGEDRKPAIYLRTPFNEHQGHLSPDGRWMAYGSDESGRWEAYVGEFPGGGSRWQISAGGGVEPRWRPDGKELFYVSPDGTLMAVTLQFHQQSVLPAAPRPLFSARFGEFGAEIFRPVYAPTHDGQKFLVNVVVEETTASPVTMILNWPAAMPRTIHARRPR
jgi:Tol biopolymer transport system component